MDHLDHPGLDLLHIRFRIPAGGFDKFNPLLDADIDISRVVRRTEGRQKREINPDRFIRPLSALANFCPQVLRFVKCEDCHKTDTAGITDRSGKFRPDDPQEPTLNNGPFNSEHFSNGCL
jgi:hypothetical protein